MKSVHWKSIREQIKDYLQRAVDGKEVIFRHQMFYGYEFQIVAKKKEVK